MWSFLLWSLLLLLFIAALVAGWLLSQLLPWRGLRLRRVKGLVVERNTIAPEDREQLDLAAAELEALGFKRIYTMATKPQYAAQPAKPAYWDVYEHPSIHAQAHVGLRVRYLPAFLAKTLTQKGTSTANVGGFAQEQPYFVWFVTCFSDQTNIMSMNQFLHHTGVITPEWQVFDDYHATLAASWHTHQQLCGNAGKAIEIDSVEVFKRMQWLMHAKIDYLVSVGLAEPVPGKKRWRYTWRGIWHMWVELQQGLRATKRGTELAKRGAASGSPTGLDRRRNANLLNVGRLNRRRTDRPNIVDSEEDKPVISTSKGRKREHSGGGISV
jgi:hypothetical protein